MIFSSSDVLSPQQLKRLSEHRYSCSGSSFVDPFMQPFWNWVTTKCPLWLAPNLMTITGLAVNIVTSLLLVCYSPTATQEVKLTKRKKKEYARLPIALYVVTIIGLGHPSRDRGRASLIQRNLGLASKLFLSIRIRFRIILRVYCSVRQPVSLPGLSWILARCFHRPQFGLLQLFIFVFVFCEIVRQLAFKASSFFVMKLA